MDDRVEIDDDVIVMNDALHHLNEIGLCLWVEPGQMLTTPTFQQLTLVRSKFVDGNLLPT